MPGPVHGLSTVLLLFTAFLIESKNVVFLPMFTTSHIRLYVHVAEELTKLNHSVWLGSPFDAAKYVQESTNVQFFWYNDFWNSSVDIVTSQVEMSVSNAVETGTPPDWQWAIDYEDYLSNAYLYGLRNGSIFEYIRKLKPDLIVLDWFPSINELVAIPFKLKVPFAVLSALQFPITAKMPFQPVAETFNSPYVRNQASLFEQAKAVYGNMCSLFRHILNDRGFMKELFPEQRDVPTSGELMSQAEVYIVQSDHIVDYPRPTLPNFKLIGCITSLPPNDLQEPFKSFVERSQKAGVGVAVFSFGTLFLNLPKTIELKLVTVLKRIKFNTVWRANITSPDADKILTSTWIPQNDLLGNKNTKVYITHSGLHSVCEGVSRGIPTVFLSIFFDQYSNARRGEQKGFGRYLDLLTATEDEMVQVIEEVAASEKIGATIGKASEIYRELYKNPKQEAAFWLDHVLQYGGSYMRSSGQKIPMYLYVLDYVIAFIVGFFVAVGSVLVCCVLKCVYCSVFKNKSHMKKD